MRYLDGGDRLDISFLGLHVAAGHRARNPFAPRKTSYSIQLLPVQHTSTKALKPIVEFK